MSSTTLTFDFNTCISEIDETGNFNKAALFELVRPIYVKLKRLDGVFRVEIARMGMTVDFMDSIVNATTPVIEEAVHAAIEEAANRKKDDDSYLFFPLRGEVTPQAILQAPSSISVSVAETAESSNNTNPYAWVYAGYSCSIIPRPLPESGVTYEQALRDDLHNLDRELVCHPAIIDYHSDLQECGVRYNTELATPEEIVEHIRKVLLRAREDDSITFGKSYFRMLVNPETSRKAELELTFRHRR